MIPPNVQKILDRLTNPRAVNGKQWEARCPSHDDKRASLSVGVGKSDRAILHCHAGCTTGQVLGKLGLRLSDLFADSETPKRRRVVATYDYVDANGELVYQVRRHEPKHFDQRRPDGKGGWIANMDGVQRTLYRLPELLASTGPVLIVEGEKDVDAVYAAGGIATCNSGGAGKWLVDLAECFRGRHVVIVADRDGPGRKHAQAVKQSLIGIASSLRIIECPGDAKDISEFLADGGAIADLLELPESAESPDVIEGELAVAGETTLPEIIASGRQLPEITAEVIEALATANRPPVLFTRGGQPVRTMVNDSGKCIIVPVGETAMRGRVARVARFFRKSKDDVLTPVSPPLDVVRDVMSSDLHESRGSDESFNFPILNAVTGIPILRPDFSILSSPGYDSITRLFYAPVAELFIPPVSDRPTTLEVCDAVNLLDDAIGEFPYASDADRANAFGTLITPAIRQAIDGKSPLALFDAPQAGTGKSLWVETAGMICIGDSPAMMGAPTDEAEWRKQITSTLFQGPTVVVIDNIDAPIASGSLARVLTAGVWSDRVLGSTQQVNLSNLATWIATGNNIELGGDMPRRCYRIRLDAKTARPWRGRTFRHPNLLEWVRENRGRLIWAMLTICRGWHAAGRPAPDSLPVIGSFEPWCKTVGSILAFAGVSGFLANLDDLYEQSDDGANEWEQFLRTWLARYGQREIPVSKLVEDLQSANGSDLRDALPEGLGGFVVYQPASYTQSGGFTIKDVGRFKIRLGKQLRQRAGRRYGLDEIYLFRRDDTHSKTAVWGVKCGECLSIAGSVAGSEVATPADLTPDSSNDTDALRGVRGVIPTLSHAHARTHTHTRTRASDQNTPRNPRTPRKCEDDPYEADERQAIQEEVGP